MLKRFLRGKQPERVREPNWIIRGICVEAGPPNMSESIFGDEPSKFGIVVPPTVKMKARLRIPLPSCECVPGVRRAHSRIPKRVIAVGHTDMTRSVCRVADATEPICLVVGDLPRYGACRERLVDPGAVGVAELKHVPPV